MYKKILQTLLMAIVLLSIHMVGAGADIVYGAAHSPADSQVEHAVYTQAGEGPVFTKVAQNVPTGELHKAAQAGAAIKISGLLRDGHDANELDKNGFTPLYYAAFAEDLDGARTLLAHGADINLRSSNGSTPLFNALEQTNKELALWLLERGAGPRIAENNGLTPLHIACLLGMEDVVTILLEKGADVNAVDNGGLSPLSAYLFMPTQLKSGSVSSSLIVRLLEAGASYDPVPVTKKPLMDICLEMANSFALERDLAALIARTKNAKLRAYAQEMLEKSRKLPARDISDVQSELLHSTKGTVYKKVESSVLGTLTRYANHDVWEAKPIAIPFYKNEKVVIFYGFNAGSDPTFVADADKAVAAFLKLNDAFRLTLSDRFGKYVQKYLGQKNFSAEAKSKTIQAGFEGVNEAWLTAFTAGKRPLDEVWRMAGKVYTCSVQRRAADGLIYVVMSLRCAWPAYDLQLAFREGKDLFYISLDDGDVKE